MSLILKIFIPILIVAGLVGLYIAKYPALLKDTQPTQGAIRSEQVPPSQITTDAQLEIDLTDVDADIHSATDAATKAAQFDDVPIEQTE